MVSFTPRLLYPRGKSPDIHWIGDWAGSRAGMNIVERRKISSPCRESNPSLSAVQPLVHQCTD
jgi:hypothetical protein